MEGEEEEKRIKKRNESIKKINNEMKQITDSLNNKVYGYLLKVDDWILEMEDVPLMKMKLIDFKRRLSWRTLDLGHRSSINN